MKSTYFLILFVNNRPSVVWKLGYWTLTTEILWVRIPVGTTTFSDGSMDRQPSIGFRLLSLLIKKTFTKIDRRELYRM